MITSFSLRNSREKDQQSALNPAEGDNDSLGSSSLEVVVGVVGRGGATGWAEDGPQGSGGSAGSLGRGSIGK